MAAPVEGYGEPLGCGAPVLQRYSVGSPLVSLPHPPAFAPPARGRRGSGEGKDTALFRGSAFQMKGSAVSSGHYSRDCDEHIRKEEMIFGRFRGAAERKGLCGITLLPASSPPSLPLAPLPAAQQIVGGRWCRVDRALAILNILITELKFNLW